MYIGFHVFRLSVQFFRTRILLTQNSTDSVAYYSIVIFILFATRVILIFRNVVLTLSVNSSDFQIVKFNRVIPSSPPPQKKEENKIQRGSGRKVVVLRGLTISAIYKSGARLPIQTQLRN